MRRSAASRSLRLATWGSGHPASNSCSRTADLGRIVRTAADGETAGGHGAAALRLHPRSTPVRVRGGELSPPPDVEAAARVLALHRQRVAAETGDRDGSGSAARPRQRRVPDVLALRVVQLDGEPILSASDWEKHSYSTHKDIPKDPNDIQKMIRDSLETEREAIEFYNNLHHKTQHTDPVTAQMVVKILADEIEDEDKLLRLLGGQ